VSPHCSKTLNPRTINCGGERYDSRSEVKYQPDV
jgi:hypothetical protein